MCQLATRLDNAGIKSWQIIFKFTFIGLPIRGLWDDLKKKYLAALLIRGVDNLRNNKFIGFLYLSRTIFWKQNRFEKKWRKKVEDKLIDIFIVSETTRTRLDVFNAGLPLDLLIGQIGQMIPFWKCCCFQFLRIRPVLKLLMAIFKFCTW